MSDNAAAERLDYEVIVIGAGFAGLYMLHSLRERGYSVHCYERGDDVGGTWYWNRYPGARCDVESLDYCYSFSKELHDSWEWTERYGSQGEILRYARHVADTLDLRRDISFGVEVVAANFDDNLTRWNIRLDDGREVSASFCVTAVGCLSSSNEPAVPGREDYSGRVYHTSNWPEDGVEIAGKRVGVIGTGSSGIQVIPEVAREARELVVFQRTPNYSIPTRNRPLSGRELWLSRHSYEAVVQAARNSAAGHYIHGTGKSALEVDDQEREATFRMAWQVGGTDILSSYNDILHDERSNSYLSAFVAEQISSLVDDPKVAWKLTPKDQPIGAKRLCLGTGYYETYNAPHVQLVDLREEPLQRFVEIGLQTSTATYDLDIIVMATGFDAITGPLTRMGMQGTDGVSLSDRWRDGPQTYLGLAIHRYPNLFTITGPGSPSVLANVIRAIEQHVEWIADCLDNMKREGFSRIEATASAQAEWTEHVDELSHHTVHRFANSWYLGANIPGKKRQFMPYLGGLKRYRDVCDEVSRDGYRGFVLSREVSA